MVIKSRSSIFFDIFNILFIGIFALLCLYPLWDTLILSVSTSASANKMEPRFMTYPVVFGSYAEVFRSKIVAVGYLNTIFRAVMGTVLTVVVTYCGAYALSKKEIPFRNFITVFILFTMFFNGGLIATYLNMVNLGLMDSRWALILPLTTSVWALLIVRNFIMTLPKELEDAAMVDGAHTLRIIFSIMLPLAAPVLAVIALWTAVQHWNSWFDALLYIRSQSKIVLQVLLRKITIEPEFYNVNRDYLVATGGTTTATVRAATVIVTIGPIILLYPFLQRYFIKGILIGSLKG